LADFEVTIIGRFCPTPKDLRARNGKTVAKTIYLFRID
jgi:hypothetical protein